MSLHRKILFGRLVALVRTDPGTFLIMTLYANHCQYEYDDTMLHVRKWTISDVAVVL